MLRRIIKSVIPSRDKVFFELFIEGADNVHTAADILVEIINNVDSKETDKLNKTLKSQRKKAVDINAAVMVELNSQFITPIDRGDIHHISASLLQLTKRIVKINKKLQVYAIDTTVDDCLISSVSSLQKITQSIANMLDALKSGDHKRIQAESVNADEMDDNVIEELGQTMKEISKANYDTLTIIKLKEVYKAIESAIDTSAYLSDVISSVSVKAI
jgi:hypothetical protein